MIGQRDRSLSSLSKAPNSEIVGLFAWDISKSPFSEIAGGNDIHTLILHFLVTCSSKFNIFSSQLVPVLHCTDRKNFHILPGTTHEGGHLMGQVGRIIDDGRMLKGCLRNISLKDWQHIFLLYIIVNCGQVVHHGSFLKNTFINYCLIHFMNNFITNCQKLMFRLFQHKDVLLPPNSNRFCYFPPVVRIVRITRNGGKIANMRMTGKQCTFVHLTGKLGKAKLLQCKA